MERSDLEVGNQIGAIDGDAFGEDKVRNGA